MEKICLILDRLRSAHNTGNIFRIAEAVGAEIIACGYTPAPPHPKLARTAMGTDQMVRCRVLPDACSAIRQLRSEGYRQIGVSPEALAEVDGLVSLPMFGKKSSINVGNAAAAILYAVVAVTQYGVHES